MITMCQDSSEGFFKTLIEKMSQEISTYRQRQITMFREAIIVLALITWGIIRLELVNNFFGFLLRFLSGVACIFVGWIGAKIIMSYKKRIYHIRQERSKLMIAFSKHSKVKDVDLTSNDPFYPINVDNLGPEYKTNPTSGIYSLTLKIMAILTFMVIVFSAFAIN